MGPQFSESRQIINILVLHSFYKLVAIEFRKSYNIFNIRVLSKFKEHCDSSKVTNTICTTVFRKSTNVNIWLLSNFYTLVAIEFHKSCDIFSIRVLGKFYVYNSIVIRLKLQKLFEPQFPKVDKCKHLGST